MEQKQAFKYMQSRLTAYMYINVRNLKSKHSQQYILFSTTTNHLQSPKMKSFIVAALFVAVAVAVPVDPKDATVVRYDNNNIGVDGYEFAVETSDGKFTQEKAVLKNVGSENAALEVTGQFSYPGPDGITYSLSYIANENGFQPQGAHLPQAV